MIGLRVYLHILLWAGFIRGPRFPLETSACLLSVLLEHIVTVVPLENDGLHALVGHERLVVLDSNLVHHAGRGIPTAGFGLVVFEFREDIVFQNPIFLVDL